MLVRFRQDVISLKPKVVVIEAGTNDLASVTGPSTEGMIAENFMSMVELAKVNGIRVVLASVTPVCDCFTNQTALPSAGQDHRPERLDQGLRGAQRLGLSRLLRRARRRPQFQKGIDQRRPRSQRRRVQRHGPARRKGDRGGAWHEITKEFTDAKTHCYSRPHRGALLAAAWRTPSSDAARATGTPSAATRNARPGSGRTPRSPQTALAEARLRLHLEGEARQRARADERADARRW